MRYDYRRIAIADLPRARKLGYLPAAGHPQGKEVLVFRDIGDRGGIKVLSLDFSSLGEKL